MNGHTVDNNLQFSSDFDGGTWSQWIEKAEATLKGGAFEDKLVRLSEDGIAQGPLFSGHTKTQATAISRPPVAHLNDRPWHVDMMVNHPQIKTANQDILDGLNGGASALTLHIDPTGNTGIALRTKNDIARLLDGVYTEFVPISLFPGANNHEYAALLAAHFAQKGQMDDTYIELNFAPCDQGRTDILPLTHWVKTHAPHWKTLSVNASTLHEAGATQAQELAGLAAILVAYIRELSADMDLETIRVQMSVSLASDQNGHGNIIKFRAARALIARIFESFDAPPEQRTLPIHAISSARMLSKMDPWSNMLRNAASVFGAICGSADFILCRPFTEPLGLATPFAQRMSRGLQLMFMDESHLAQVQDPAAGSYTHEHLTNALAHKAWSLFQTLEQKGGWFAKDAQQFIKNQISLAHQTRKKAIKDGTTVRVGVNQYTKPDIRPADIRPQPLIKTRNGQIIDAKNIEGRLVQAKDGNLLAAKPPEICMPCVRDYEDIETAMGEQNGHA